MKPLLQVEKIEFSYPRSPYRMRIEEFTCNPGQTVAIVGPSGCGKTTFLNLIAGILQPEQGRIEVDGVELNSLRPTRSAAFRLSRMGLIFPEFELVEHLSVGDNILLPLYLGLRNDRTSLEATAKQLAEKMGIERYWSILPASLSHGERQRAAICRALSTSPTLVLADEPTGNLDSSNKHRTVRLMIDSARKNRQALVVATHDVELLDSFDRVIHFEDLNQSWETTCP